MKINALSSPGVPLGRQLGHMYDFVADPCHASWIPVRDQVLKPLGLFDRFPDRPFHNSFVSPADDGRKEAFVSEIRRAARPHFNAALAGIMQHPSQRMLQAARISVENFPPYVGRGIIDERSAAELFAAAEKYLQAVGQARLSILTASRLTASTYMEKFGVAPDPVSICYLWQIDTAHQFYTCTMHNFRNQLRSMRTLFTAHQLPTDLLLDAKDVHSPLQLHRAQVGALAMIAPQLESDLVKRYLRAQRYNPFIVGERTELVRYARDKGVIEEDTYVTLMEMHPASLWTRLLAGVRRLFKKRMPPVKGSMDEFLVEHVHVNGAREPVIHEPHKSK